MTDQFSQVRHYLGIAEEATANREAQDKETIAEQAKYISQLERDTLELEKMTKLLAGCLIDANVPAGQTTGDWLAWAEREARK